MTEQPVWTETDSRDFLDLAEIAVPARNEQSRLLLHLIPPRRAGFSLMQCVWLPAGHAIYEGDR